MSIPMPSKRSRGSAPPVGGEDLVEAVTRAGFYPELVLAALDTALAGEETVASLVQSDTTFDDAVHRHLTALALTPSRFILVHVDDAPAVDGVPAAVATSEAVPLSAIRSVALTRGVSRPAADGGLLSEMTIAVSWGSVHRLDLEPAGCADPSCEAEHGLTGTSVPDDVIVRVSAGVEGARALAEAEHFARVLSRATVPGAGRL